jgi:Ni,Fe-hydrogenase III small subunit
LDQAARDRLGRSLSIRQVDAGSCNGGETEIHALNNAFNDLERTACASSPPPATPTCCW